MIQQLQKGDQKVLGQIYRQYRSDFIAWMKSKYGCNREAARDIYQDTILTLSLKVQNGTVTLLDSRLKTYIYGIAKNKYKEYKRSNGRYVHVEDSTWTGIKEPELDSPKQEDAQLVHKCLKQLGEPCKSVLELYYFHGLRMEEIKEILVYKNSNTVKNMKYKCLVRLREIYQKELEKRINS